jgi:3'-5' exoribonuclease
MKGVQVKKHFVDELGEGELVQDVFLVKQSLLKTTKAGNLFLSLTLADRSGAINAIFWDATRQLHESFAPDDFIMVRASVETYKTRSSHRLLPAARPRSRCTMLSSAACLSTRSPSPAWRSMWRSATRSLTATCS